MLNDIREDREFFSSCVGNGDFENAKDTAAASVRGAIELLGDCNEENRKMLLGAAMEVIRDYAEMLRLPEAPEPDSENTEQEAAGS